MVYVLIAVRPTDHHARCDGEQRENGCGGAPEQPMTTNHRCGLASFGQQLDYGRRAPEGDSKRVKSV
ncbi:MAG TPA: hypothetical protein VG056_00315 [Pirellulales bacterium]|nr:hypothetical protein [Pirellulales bacterium]